MAQEGKLKQVCMRENGEIKSDNVKKEHLVTASLIILHPKWSFIKPKVSIKRSPIEEL